jgi:hypothetical protein
MDSRQSTFSKVSFIIFIIFIIFMFCLWLFFGGFVTFIPYISDGHNETAVSFAVGSWLLLPITMSLSLIKKSGLPVTINTILWISLVINAWLLLG